MRSSRAWRGVTLLLAALLAPAVAGVAVPTVRIKEIAAVQGLRENQLVGVGLVTGLAGRGDSSTSTLLRTAVANLVANFGFHVEPSEVRSRNCAVVTVTATVPPFVRPGESVDVLVSSLGDARSLEGGVLLQTPLQGANGEVYAVAQGKITVPPGTAARSTVGRIPGGALAEREVLSQFLQNGTLSILLRTPDFITASTVAAAIAKAFPEANPQSPDPSRIEVQIPSARQADPVGFVAELEALEVIPDVSGRVVIDAASGVIIFGEGVRIGKVAVSYKDVAVEVGATGLVGSAFGLPAGLEGGGAQIFAFGETTTVDELVQTMKEIGLSTEAIIAIIQAIDKAGALYGRLVVM